MNDRPAVLLLGGTGQIGHEVARELAWLGPVSAPTRREADLTDARAVPGLVRNIAPRIVVNAAGYTAVDAAESDTRPCMQLNAELPEVLARETKRTGALLVHFSTDYVFDGTKAAPYVESDSAHPLNAYGAAKLAGEQAIASAGGVYLTFRTSWIYAARGRNFPLTMLRLARERETLHVVNDQVGAPTSAAAIASAVSRVLRALNQAPDFHAASEAATGLYHMTASGSTTWFEFAKAILADDARATEQICREVQPIATADYPTPATRPAYSVLDNSKLAERFGVRLPAWQEQWRAVAAQLT